MKKRRLLFFLTTFLVALTTSFVVVASAFVEDRYFTNTKVIYVDSNCVDYDASEAEALDKTVFKNPLDWDNVKIADVPKTSGPFRIVSGASIKTNVKNLMRFYIVCTQGDYAFYERSGDRMRFTFMLLRQGLEKDKYYEFGTYEFTYDALLDTITVVDLQEQKQYASAHFNKVLEFEDLAADYSDGSVDGLRYPQPLKFAKAETEEIAEMVTCNVGDYYLSVSFEVPSVYTEYRLLFSAAREKQERVKVKDGWFKYHYEWQYSGEPYEQHLIASDVRSYYTVLNNMNNAGMLEEDLGAFPEMLEYAEDVLRGEPKTVTVEYLENIADEVPFAKKVQKTISVKMWPDQTTLSPDDVAGALGINGVNALISPCRDFTYNATTGVYEAYYYPSVYLEARTVDGAMNQYILNPNKSYADYYSQLVTDDVISQDLYEYMYSTQILSVYPEIGSILPENLYGYFGYIVIPATFTYNQAFKELFNTELTFDGTVKSLDYEHSISLSAYNKLLNDYDYGWLARIWNDVWGALTECNAQHIFIFADCTATEGFVNANGGTSIDDTDGLIQNEVGTALKNVADKVGDGLDDFGALFSRSAGFGVGSLLLVAAVVLVFMYRDKIFKRR